MTFDYGVFACKEDNDEEENKSILQINKMDPENLCIYTIFLLNLWNELED